MEGREERDFYTDRRRYKGPIEGRAGSTGWSGNDNRNCGNEQRMTKCEQAKAIYSKLTIWQESQLLSFMSWQKLKGRQQE